MMYVQNIDLLLHAKSEKLKSLILWIIITHIAGVVLIAFWHNTSFQAIPKQKLIVQTVSIRQSTPQISTLPPVQEILEEVTRQAVVDEETPILSQEEEKVVKKEEPKVEKKETPQIVEQPAPKKQEVEKPKKEAIKKEIPKPEKKAPPKAKPKVQKKTVPKKQDIKKKKEVAPTLKKASTQKKKEADLVAQETAKKEAAKALKKEQERKEALFASALASIEGVSSLQEKKSTLSSAASSALQKKAPSSISTLHADEPLNIQADDGGENFSRKERSYYEELVSRLKLHLRLPEYGPVKLKLTLSQDGKVMRLVVTSTKSKKNREYVEKMLTKLSFQRFGDNFTGQKEHTFSLKLSNEVSYN